MIGGLGELDGRIGVAVMGPGMDTLAGTVVGWV